MSTVPVRYTNHHHVVPPKTASPIVVAVNKAVVRSPSTLHRHHQHQHQKRQQQQQHLGRHRKAAVAARSNHRQNNGRRPQASISSVAAAAAAAASRKGKKKQAKNGGAGAVAGTKQQPLAITIDMDDDDHQQAKPASAATTSTAAAAAQQMVMVVVSEEGEASGVASQPATMMVNGGGGGANQEWGTMATSVAEDGALRMPDAAALNAAEISIQDNCVERMDTHNSGTDSTTTMTTITTDHTLIAGMASASTSNVAAPVAEPQRLPHAQLWSELQEALTLEAKYQATLYLPQTSQEGEITVGARDGAAHVLRCLKVWYELPTDVLFAAINLVDRFLAKMRVRPKHLACISVGSLYLATDQALVPMQLGHALKVMNTEDLALISQCRCTAGDLERMAGVIANKLGVQPRMAPVTALTFIRVFYHLFRNAAHELGLGHFYDTAITLPALEQRLEVLACNATCTMIRPSELALVLICTQMDGQAASMVNGQISGLVDYAIELQKVAQIPDESFFHSHSTVVGILAQYNNQHKMPYKQRLLWKLSTRTMRVLRPSNKMTSYLPTIAEHNQVNFDRFSRLSTGSLSSEDDEDWPTSPVVPMYEEL